MLTTDFGSTPTLVGMRFEPTVRIGIMRLGWLIPNNHDEIEGFNNDFTSKALLCPRVLFQHSATQSETNALGMQDFWL
jgi:hypothetical protein